MNFQPVQTFHLHAPPPSVNNAFINLKQGGRAKSAAYKDWLETARWTIAAHHPKRFDGPVVVDVEMVRPRANSDLDNRFKGIADALSGLVYVDDKQIHALSMCWSDVDGVVVRVRPYVAEARKERADD